MLTRRNAILASAAFAVGAANHRSQAEPNHPPASPSHSVFPFTVEHAADQCLQCAESASMCISSAANSTDSDVGEFIKVCQDTSEICIVTATILTRQGPLSQAICQACADACDRLTAACAEAKLNGLEHTCSTLAARCATVCRALIR